jgi:hypothetical protein
VLIDPFSRFLVKITQQHIHVDEVIVILPGQPVNMISLTRFVVEAKNAYPVGNERETIFVTMGASGKRPRHTPDHQLGEQIFRHWYPALYEQFRIHVGNMTAD